MPFAALLVFLLLELFFIYMPFSKLIHYIAKYFTFHQALWDDGFKAAGDATDRQLVRQLGYTASWAGPHMVPGKTWLEEVQLTGYETIRRPGGCQEMSPKKLVPFKDFGKDTGEPLVTLDPADMMPVRGAFQPPLNAPKAQVAGEL